MFSRSWRLYQLLFPGTGSEFGRPNEVSQTVVPVWDAFRLGLNECLLQSQEVSTAAAPGAVDVVHNFTGPERGRIYVPLSLAVYENSAVVEVAESWIGFNAASRPDPWGNFNAGAAGMFIHSVSMPAGAAAASKRNLPAHTFIPFGNNVFVRWVVPTAGTNLISHMTWMNVPGEILSILPFFHVGSPQ